jgi:hypothetical protein
MEVVILSTASRRDDRGVDLPTNGTGEAVRKAVDKLIRARLLEEIRANLARRRDAEAGPMALRITKQGLEATGVMLGWALLRRQALARLPRTPERRPARIDRTRSHGRREFMNNSKAYHRNDALRLVHKGSYLQRTRKGNLSLHHFSEREICYGCILTWSSDWSIRSRRHQDPSQEFSGLFFLAASREYERQRA